MTHLKGWNPRKRADFGALRNDDRAEKGDRVLGAYNLINGGSDDDRSDYIDCLTDLFHSMAACGIDPHSITQTALMHFEAER